MFESSKPSIRISVMQSDVKEQASNSRSSELWSWKQSKVEFKAIVCYWGSLLLPKDTEEPSPTNRQQNNNTSYGNALIKEWLQSTYYGQFRKHREGEAVP